jgi:hypothetical protein
MRRVLALIPLLFVLDCGISQDELEGIDGVWSLDSVKCFTSITDASTLKEVWAVDGSGSTLTLGITGRDISMTGNSGTCSAVSYGLEYLFTQRDGLREGNLDYTILTKTPQACTVTLDYFDGTNIDPGQKYTFDINPIANKLYNNYFQRVDDNTLLLELPGNIIGSPGTGAGEPDKNCANNCACYGAFVK